MDRLETMSILLTVVEAGSLSGASRKLRLPLATLSRRISDLEQHLRTRLLVRTSRRLELTDAGRAYVAACKQILEQVEEAELAAAGEYAVPKGELILTAPVVFGRLHVLPVILKFLEAFPDIDIRIVLADRVMHLLEDRVDIAVRIGALPDSNLRATAVGTIRLVTCASPSYFAAHGKPETPEALSKHNCITFEGLMSPQVWTFRTAKTDVSVRVHSRLVVNTAESAIDAAVASLGITRVLSYQVERPLRSGLLEIALGDYEPQAWPVSLVHSDQRQPLQKVRAFMDFAAPMLRARLSGNIP